MEAVEASREFGKLLQTGRLKNVDDKMVPMITALSKDISQQRERLGGDWSVAYAVFSRKQRQLLRELLGPDLVFVVLNMTKDCMVKRLRQRHGDAAERFIKTFENFSQLYEPAGEDEAQAFNLDITEDMDKDHVLAKVLETI